MARLMMDHLTFALYDVPEAAGPIRLAATFPKGMSAALALVGREGRDETGAVTTELLELRRGGTGGVTLEDPARFYDSGGRVTAVLVNTDSSTELGWDDRVQDWAWLRDDQLAQRGGQLRHERPARDPPAVPPPLARRATGSRSTRSSARAGAWSAAAVAASPPVARAACGWRAASAEGHGSSCG